MTPEEYDDEIRRLRKSGEVFRSTVVAGLNAAIERLDEENAELEKSLAACREDMSELAIDRVYGGPVRPVNVSALVDLKSQIANLEKTLAIVTRDRDALIQRAVTAENTLRNHGFNMHTMTREPTRYKIQTNPPPIIGPQGTTGFGPEWGRGHTSGGTIP